MIIQFAKFQLIPLLCLSAACCLLSSCLVENASSLAEPETKSYELADRELWSYFQTFETEALKRDILIDLNTLDISAVIEKISEDGVAGTCQYGQHIHHVTIDQSYWSRAQPLQREMVVFHELGHCVLGKAHTETANRANTCMSLMNSGTTGCHVAYNSQNRAYYLDELFSNID